MSSLFKIIYKYKINLSICSLFTSATDITLQVILLPLYINSYILAPHVIIEIALMKPIYSSPYEHKKIIRSQLWSYSCSWSQPSSEKYNSLFESCLPNLLQQNSKYLACGSPVFTVFLAPDYIGFCISVSNLWLPSF